MRKLLLCLLPLSIFTHIAGAQHSFDLLSPDGKIKVQISISDRISYSIRFNGQNLVLPSSIALRTSSVGSNDRLRLVDKKTRSVHTVIESPVPEKRKFIPDVYNEISIQLREPFGVQFRAFNDGIAYRWVTRFKDSVTIKEEIAEVQFAGNYKSIFSAVQKRADADIFHTSFEEPYQEKNLDSITPSHFIFSPMLVQAENGISMVLTESDLEDYPGMFLQGENNSKVHGTFAPYPLEEKVVGEEFKQSIVTRRADFIAKTKGSRSFPWRVIAVVAQDKELPGNDIVYRLASPSRINDASWIKPGQGTDEWIIGVNLFNVPFKAGINTETYKYYIDFAKRFGLERIMLDAGWSDNNDLFSITPTLNMDEIAAYAKKQGIKLSMWTLAMTLNRQLEPALKQFQKWGVDFIMTDFMDRDDQEMVKFCYRIAEACAKYKIMVMFHGAFKPAGFNRTYPHAITREGVLGSEYNIWSEKATPEHNVLLPFIRMLSGPMDYEPGLLDNATKEMFRPIAGKVMSIGTRASQLAMFVVYDSPVQIFSGNPSQGLLEPEFMDLLGSIPTIWDETKILDARIGDYIITARKKGRDWFIGAMTDGKSREFTIPLQFMEEGIYEATICEDGVNADRYASDYRLVSSEMRSTDSILMKLAPGGGFVARLKKK